MPEEATRRVAWGSARRLVPPLAIAAAALGVVLTWTSEGPVRLDGLQGPNNGWLVLIFAAVALGWTRSAARGSWVGVIGVLGASIVMGWTAVENWLDGRQVLGASASFGLVLVVAASAALAVTAVVRGVELARGRRAGSLRGERA